MTPEALAAIHGACFETPRPWAAEEFAELLGSPGVFLCDVPDGFALGRFTMDEAELLTLAVRPQARRKGLGRQLLAAFETKARTLGAVRVLLEVAAENTAAIALYEAFGYEQDGLRKDYYRSPRGTRVHALVYSKSPG